MAAPVPPAHASGMTLLKPLRAQASCGSCSLNRDCFGAQLPGDLVVRGERPLHRGDVLFHSGDRLHSLYLVRTGCIKTACSSGDGEEQVLGFHMPGDLFGMTGLMTGRFSDSAMALENTSLCRIPYDALEHLSARDAGLRRRLWAQAAQRIRALARQSMSLAKLTADRRLADFVLELAERQRARGYSPLEFRLSMSGNDIASYLGMAPETVSRGFHGLQRQGVAQLERKRIRIHDLAALEAVSRGREDPPRMRA